MANNVIFANVTFKIISTNTYLHVYRDYTYK